MNASRLLVVDASVAVKWFVSEEYANEALALRTRGLTLIAPDILLADVANVFLKKLGRKEMPEEVAITDLDLLADQVTLSPSSTLLIPAFRLGLAHGRSLYDSLYVALALQEQCQLVSADERLCNALRPAFGDTLLWLGELPPPTV